MRKIFVLFAALMLQCGGGYAQKHIKDSVQLEDVYVVGKSKAQRLREGAITVNAVDIAAKVNTLTNLNDIVWLQNETTIAIYIEVILEWEAEGLGNLHACLRSIRIVNAT